MSASSRPMTRRSAAVGAVCYNCVSDEWQEQADKNRREVEAVDAVNGDYTRVLVHRVHGVVLTASCVGGGVGRASALNLVRALIGLLLDLRRRKLLLVRGELGAPKYVLNARRLLGATSVLLAPLAAVAPGLRLDPGRRHRRERGIVHLEIALPQPRSGQPVAGVVARVGVRTCMRRHVGVGATR